LRILIVEDEARIAAFLGRAFTAEGLRADVVSDVDQAIGRALALDYELVILDLCFPTGDGFEFLRQVRERGPGLPPVLVLSARDDLPTKLRSFELGAVDYVSKPFSLEELLARVRVWLSRGRAESAEHVIRVGALELDVARREARVGATVTQLADREFRVLQFLMLNVGQVISRQRLLSEVWGYDFDPRSNVVDVCIRRLRARLGPDAPIETVRNAGYRAAA
jgi:two-component system, OmpR family, copper resistance phosphate regulon response regulator CusR